MTIGRGGLRGVQSRPGVLVFVALVAISYWLHRKTMPVILTTPAELDAWLTWPTEDARAAPRARPGS